MGDYSNVVNTSIRGSNTLASTYAYAAWNTATSYLNQYGPGVADVYQALIQEESSNRQWGADGVVLVSKSQYDDQGNLIAQGGTSIGLAQINLVAHPVDANGKINGLDPYNAEDNLKLGAQIFGAAIRSAAGHDPPYSPEEISQGIYRYVGRGPAASAAVAKVADILGPEKSAKLLGDVTPYRTQAFVTTKGYQQGGLSAAVEQAVIAQGQDLSPDVVAELNPDFFIAEGLDETPWWKAGLVTQNPWLKQVSTPVTFEVQLPRNKGPLADSSGHPISVQLNASLSHFEVQAGHVIIKTPSRTALHLTIWGQEADLISGEGSTGAFMNALGLTSFLSMSNVSSDVLELVTKAFKVHYQGKDYKAQSEALYNSASLNTNDMRIAARDAFMEFLALFKANGIVWFRNSSYSSAFGGKRADQTGLSAFSPVTGSSNYQMNSRTNDVLDRGQVAMKFRNSVYSGYFKSLDYSIDADTPYFWKFRFVFQVESTLTLNPYPGTPTLTPAPNNIATPQLPLEPIQTLQLTGKTIKG